MAHRTRVEQETKRAALFATRKATLGNGHVKPARGFPANLTARTVMLGEAHALAYLERNTLNRSVTDRLVERLAADMLAGNWRLNGEPIIFTTDGQLLDGQHRLWAIVEAARTNPKIELPFLVVEGVEPDVMPTIDTGKARGFANVLQIGGHLNTNVLAATVRMCMWYDSGVGKAEGFATPSNTTMEEYLQDHPEIADRVNEACRKTPLKAMASHSLWGFLYYQASLISQQKAGEWLGLLTTGAGLDENHPVLQYRARLMAMKDGSGTKRYHDERVALGIKCWNLFVTGRRVSRLVWQPTREDQPRFTSVRPDKRPTKV